MRTLRRLRIPTLVFVNKIDRRGARCTGLLRELAGKLTPAVLPVGAATGLGTPSAAATAYGADTPGFAASLVDTLTLRDEALLAAYVRDGSSVSYARLRTELAAQTGRALVHPVYFGSAVTGAGIDALVAGLRELLPRETGDPEGPVSGRVFKVERGPAGEKVAYVRLRSGTVRTRDRLCSGGARADAAREAKVTGVRVFEGGGEGGGGAAVRRASVAAGQIGQLWGLGDVQVGDQLGGSPALVEHAAETGHFAPPTLETVVRPQRDGDRRALHLALTQLAEQDPLINLRQDETRDDLIHLSLYGEVQKEVIQATLADDFGVRATFEKTTPICVERLTGTGAAAEFLKRGDNPFLATVGLRVEPATPGSGVTYGLDVELGSMPYSLMRAVEETVRATLRQGPHGWEIPDCVVTMTHSGYYPRQSHSHAVFDKSMSSTAGDFRQLTPLVLMDALRQAGTRVCEPLHHFQLEAPAEAFGTLLPVLSRLGAVPDAAPDAAPDAGESYTLTGEIPAASVHELEQRRPGLTGGEGMWESAFHRYHPVSGPPPARERTDHDPTDRRLYLLRVQRRVSGLTGG